MTQDGPCPTVARARLYVPMDEVCAASSHKPEAWFFP